jgi:general secretion pathway protein D
MRTGNRVRAALRFTVTGAVCAALALAGCSTTVTQKPKPPQISVTSESAPPTPVAPRPSVPVTPPAQPPAAIAPTSPPQPSLSVGAAPPRQIPQPSLAPPVAVSPPATTRAPEGAPPAGAAQPTQRLVVFNFDDADVEVVLQAAAEVASFNYVLGPGAKGKKITVQTVGKIPADEVFPVLLTILDANGLAAVRSGNLYRIIPKEGAPQTSIRTVVGRELDPKIASDEVVTQIVPLQFVGTADAIALLRPFVAAQGALTAHRETNLLIVTDAAANLRRLLDMVRLIDVEVALDELQIIPIKHADAQDLAQLLNQLFTSGRLRGGPGALVPGALPLPLGPLPAPAPAAGAPRPPTPGADAGPGGERVPLIVAERRSNSVVVHARKQEMEGIRRLIAKLDVDIYGGQRVFIYFAENTKAKDLAATLDAIYGRGDRGPAARPVAAATPAYPGAPIPPSPILPPPATRAPALGPRGQDDGTPFGADIRFIADEVTNAIIVTTYPRLWTEIAQTIKTLDRLARQVLIEVLVAEVTLTDDTTLGIEWAVRSGRYDFSQSPSGVLPPRPSRSLLPGGGSPGGGPAPLGLNFYTFATDQFLAALNALNSENRVNVLSSPSIMTAENKKAVINVSTSVPIVTSQQVPVASGGGTSNSITQTVEYKDAGIILTVTPRIGEQGTVALDVKQEVNDVGAAEPPPINSPRIRKREAETSVVLLNNQTLVLGGLIQNKRSLVRTGIPLLNRIPILGLLFGSTEEKLEKTELLLLITPRVIGTALDAARITDQMRKITPEIGESIQQAPRPPSIPTQ